MFRSSVLAFLLVITAAPAFVGCSPARQPLLRVGDQTVTVEDFERAARGSEAQYPGPPSVARATLVQDLLRRALMLEYARRSGQASAPVVAAADRDNEHRALLQTLFSRLAPPQQRVSEAEARALYEARKVQAQVSMICTPTLESCRAALAALRSGAPFAEVARMYNLPNVVPPDGDMGMVPPGSLPEPLETALRTQPVGAIGGPFEIHEGWCLIRIGQRIPREQPDWEAMRAGMFDLARQRKQRAAINRAYADLKAEWQLAPAPGGAQLLFRVLSPAEPLRPTPEQLRMPLATSVGGVYTLADALRDAQDASVQRPPAGFLPAVELWIETQAMMHVAELEARRRHLHEEPDLAASLRRKREDLLLEAVYQQAVAMVPPPGPELVDMAWQQMKSRFTRLSEAQVTEVVSADSGLVMKLIRQGAQTRSLAEAARITDSSLAAHDTTLHYPNTDPQWTTLEGTLQQMQPGAWFGPQPVATGWRVLQLVNKTLLQPDFTDLPPAVQQNIAGSAAEMARDVRFQQFSDSLARAYQPDVNRALVARLPWPVNPPLDVDR